MSKLYEIYTLSDPHCNGVYKAGFATHQDAYEDAGVNVFETFDWLESRLARKRYLIGERLTEADVRLFLCLIEATT